jgi:hypothetical protein
MRPYDGKKTVELAPTPRRAQTIGPELGALLWRRVYRAHAELDSHVPLMLADTLERLLRQAEVEEPADRDIGL